MTNHRSSILTRREMMYLTVLSGVGLVLPACGDDGSNDATAPTNIATPSPDCVLTPEGIEGPFYADVNLVRRDITEGQPGKPLELQITVVDAETCTPITDASVDVWHADARGQYSAFPGQGDDQSIDMSDQKFLRGIQNTDSAGLATFDTIYPGWYQGRTTHIHLKVHLNERARVTSQLFFPDDTSTAVYNAAPYRERGPKDTTNQADGFSGGLETLRMAVTEVGDKLVATRVIGIASSS